MGVLQIRPNRIAIAIVQNNSRSNQVRSLWCAARERAMATAAIGHVDRLAAFSRLGIDDLPVLWTRERGSAARRTGIAAGALRWEIFREVIRYGFEISRTALCTARDHIGNNLAPTFACHTVAENHSRRMACSANSLDDIAAGSIGQYGWLSEYGNCEEQAGGDASQPAAKRSIDFESVRVEQTPQFYTRDFRAVSS